MGRNRLREIGLLVKPHGYKGGVLVRFDTLPPEDIESMETLFLLIDGRAVPFLVDMLQLRRDDSMVVHFKWYDTRDKVAAFPGARVLIESDETDDEPVDHSMLEGFSLYDQSGVLRGEIVSVTEGRYQWLATVAASGGQRFMVPLHEDIITEIDINRRRITISLPDGIEETG